MMLDMEHLLQVDNLTAGVHNRAVLSNVSFHADAGETVIIIGSNGVGKSVLVKTVLGLLPRIGGSVVWQRGVRIGYVPQKFALDKNIPINVNEFLSLKSGTTKQDRVRSLLAVGLHTSYLEKPISTLSGGQFQRVIIAWALVDNPTVILFDEPTESIDLAGQASIYGLLDTLKHERGISIFLVTHDIDIMYAYGDRVLCLGDGKIICRENPKKTLSKKTLEEVYGHTLEHHHHAV